MFIKTVKMRIYVFLLLLLFFSFMIYFINLKQKQNEKNLIEGHFWVFTDAHVDIFYQSASNPLSHCHDISTTNIRKINRKFGQFNCDIPIDLLHSAFSAANKIDSNVDFIIWLGDAASHLGDVNDTTISVYENISQSLIKYFPGKLIIPVLGNHDIDIHINHSIRFKEFYYKSRFDLLLKDEYAQRTFLKGGYYSIRYQSFGMNNNKNKSFLRFVVLNTAMFQPDYVYFFDTNEAIDQISWFNQTMSDAYYLNDRILLLAHVPFGIDEMTLKPFYQSEYQQKLLSIIDKYSNNIIMCLTGHRHQDTFRVYSSNNSLMGILNHPSITPHNYSSEPSIRYYSYNRKSLILYDYEQYILNLFETEQTQIDQWLLSYRFSSWYHQPKLLTSENLLQLIHLIEKNTFYLKRFLLTQHYREKILLTKEKIHEKLCSLTKLNFNQFLLCINISNNKKIQYENMFINYSLASNVLINEQFIQYNISHLYIIIILLIIAYIVYKIKTLYCTFI